MIRISGVMQYLLDENLISRFVASIDALTSRQVPGQVMALRSPDGVFEASAVSQPETPIYKYDRVIYYNPTGQVGDDYHFSLQTNGTFVLNGSPDNWKVEPKHKMQLSEQCLQDHDCPYLHLHAGGVLVVNYIDKVEGWQQKNILRMYNFSDF